MTSAAAEYGKTNAHIPFTHPHTSMPALAGREEEKDTPFPADLNRAQLMPGHLPFFYPKSFFPVITGDMSETEATLERFISSGKTNREKNSTAL